MKEWKVRLKDCKKSFRVGEILLRLFCEVFRGFARSVAGLGSADNVWFRTTAHMRANVRVGHAVLANHGLQFMRVHPCRSVETTRIQRRDNFALAAASHKPVVQYAHMFLYSFVCHDALRLRFESTARAWRGSIHARRRRNFKKRGSAWHDGLFHEFPQTILRMGWRGSIYKTEAASMPSEKEQHERVMLENAKTLANLAHESVRLRVPACTYL
jgi:hypothetical protein